MNKRAKELAELGQLAYSRSNKSEYPALIDAIAVMLAAPAASKKAKYADDSLPFTPKDMHERLHATVGDKVMCFPYQGASFGRLGKTLHDIPGLEVADLDRLVGWIEAGGLEFWKGVCTFQHVVTNCPKWFAVAREWDRRGRQSLKRNGSNVGASSALEDVGSMFK